MEMINPFVVNVWQQKGFCILHIAKTVAIVHKINPAHLYNIAKTQK